MSSSPLFLSFPFQFKKLIPKTKSNIVKEFTFSTLTGDQYCVTVVKQSKSGIILNIKNGETGETHEKVFVSPNDFVDLCLSNNIYKVEFVKKDFKTFSYFLNIYTVQLKRSAVWK